MGLAIYIYIFGAKEGIREKQEKTRGDETRRDALIKSPYTIYQQLITTTTTTTCFFFFVFRGLVISRKWCKN